MPALASASITLPYIAGGKIVADGKLDDALWSKAFAFAVDEKRVPEWNFFGTHVVGGKQKKNEGAQIRMAAADDGLAFAVTVDKGGEAVTAENGNWWDNDCVEIFTDPENKGGKPAKQIFLAYRQSKNDAAAASDKTIKIGRSLTASGYLLEAFLPWQALGFSGRPDKQFGLDFQFDFAAPGRGRVLQMAAATAINEAWISAKHYLKAEIK